MPSPYPLPQGCIFRERFENPALASQNGLVITGNPWLGTGLRGIYPKTGTFINVPRLGPVRAAGVTVIADTTLPAFDGTRRILFRSWMQTGGIDILQVGRNSVDNTLYWSSSADGLKYSSTYTPGRRLIAYVTGTGFFIDGVLRGSVPLTLGAGGSGVCWTTIGQPHVDTQNWNAPLFELLVFNYAMQADEVQEYTRLIRGLT